MVATTGQSEQFSGTVPNGALEPLPGFWQDFPAGFLRHDAIQRKSIRWPPINTSMWC